MPCLQPRPDAPAPTHTALIVTVPQAEPVVSAHRRRFDVAASWGVPAHVTVLFPFVSPTDVDDELLSRLATVVGSVTAFSARFAETGWFGDDVLWLAPKSDAPFRALTDAVWQAFPDHPPYDGAHDDVVPHLTVAERRLGDLDALRAAERDVRRGLPLSTEVDRVLLIAGAEAPASWRVVAELPLSSR